MATSAPSAMQAAHLSSLPAVTITLRAHRLGQLDGGDADAAGAALHQQVSPACRRRSVEHVLTRR
jgi:acyl-coenzyme A thioesterase PaaI-like protein